MLLWRLLVMAVFLVLTIHPSVKFDWELLMSKMKQIVE
jgi:hypothetical protein